eukprot:NODE_57_length_28844_cov_0.352687.p14 type:complete len:270 gc:universal NODE_57_length_28844_cov_0.352687:23810-23001(-)
MSRITHSPPFCKFMHTEFKPLPTPVYSSNKNPEKQLQSHLQKLKKEFHSKEHKKLIQKAKIKWEEELENNKSEECDEKQNLEDGDNLTPKTKKLSRQEKRARKRKEEQDQLEKQLIQNPGIDYKKIELDKLKIILENDHLSLDSMQDVEGDGDCMFTSVSFELHKHKISKTAKELRNLSVDYIEAHLEDFEPFYGDEEPFAIYLKEMRKNHWGGYLELNALSSIFNMEIKVYSIDGPQIISNTKKSKFCIKLIYLKHYLALGEHYNCFQ